MDLTAEILESASLHFGQFCVRVPNRKIVAKSLGLLEKRKKDFQRLD